MIEVSDDLRDTLFTEGASRYVLEAPLGSEKEFDQALRSLGVPWRRVARAASCGAHEAGIRCGSHWNVPAKALSDAFHGTLNW